MNKYPGFETLMDYETSGDSKERIINSAIYCFAQEGYAKTTTRGIAEMAEVSEALLFKYFGNKQRLLGAVSVEIVEKRIPKLFEYRLKEVIADVLTFNEDTLRHIMKDKFKYIAANVGYFKIIFVDLDSNSEGMVEQLKTMFEGFFHELEGKIIMMQKMGIVKKNLKPRTLFRSVAGMLNFLMLDVTLFERELDIDEEIDTILELLLNGVKA